MNVAISLHSACGLRTPAKFQDECLSAPMRASAHSITHDGLVTVEAAGRVWLSYRKGRLMRSHDIGVYEMGYERECITEMIEVAEVFDLSSFPRRFPVKLESVK